MFAGIAGGVALASAVEAVGYLARMAGFPIVEQPWIEAIVKGGAAAPLAVFAVTAVVVAPLGEELFYRGWMFPFLATANTPLAYVASAALFGAIHLNPAALPAYALLGAAFAWLYQWSGSVWTPVLAHATNNLIAVSALLLTH